MTETLETLTSTNQTDKEQMPTSWSTVKSLRPWSGKRTYHIQQMLTRLSTLGVLARDQCKVTDRKPTYDENNEPVIKTLYEGVISTDITETEKTKRYKVELHDGEVKCIIDNGQITVVEITGHDTMEYNNKNKYNGHFEKGLKHGGWHVFSRPQKNVQRDLDPRYHESKWNIVL